MGLKKSSKVSAEFSMSSLTDIIFLLLIFFMLTSTLVAPNSVNIKLPREGKSNSVSASDLDEVKIDRKGRYYFNGRRTKFADLEKKISRKARLKGKEKYNFLLAPDKSSPIELTIAVMDLSMRVHAVNTLVPDI